jgi:hypothetical protein
LFNRKQTWQDIIPGGITPPAGNATDVGAYNNATDWIGLDTDSDGVYTSASDTLVDADDNYYYLDNGAVGFWGDEN